MRGFLICVLMAVGCGGGPAVGSLGGSQSTGQPEALEPSWRVASWCMVDPDQIAVTVDDSNATDKSANVAVQWAFGDEPLGQFHYYQHQTEPLHFHYVFPATASELTIRVFTSTTPVDTVLLRYSGNPC